MTIDITGAAATRMSRREIAAFARKVLGAAGGQFPELSIAFVDDATMKSLNRKYRKKNKTTDVLTFEDEEACEIVISIDQARRQARDENHGLTTEIRYLLLHGLLHGLGYDHETDHGEMNALELTVRERVGLDRQ